MTVFSMRGSKIVTDLDGQIKSVDTTMLDTVTRIGTNTLDVAYLGDEANAFSVSLSDYNLLFDKVHINDADLPDQVEYFDLASGDGFSVRILNFLFETDEGIEERMFSVGKTALPAFKTPAEASQFFAQHEPALITSQDDRTIHLDQITGIETSGVFINLEDFDTALSLEDDGFEFVDMDMPANVDTWMIEADAVAAHLQQGDTGQPANDPEPTAEDWQDAPIDLPDLSHQDGL